MLSKLAPAIISVTSTAMGFGLLVERVGVSILILTGTHTRTNTQRWQWGCWKSPPLAGGLTSLSVSTLSHSVMLPRQCNLPVL